MRHPAAMLVTVTVVVVLLLSVVPARAASDNAAITSASHSFHALHRIAEEAGGTPVALSDDELASITGGRRGIFGILGNLNLGIIVQINVCAICAGVSQSNVGVIGQGVLLGGLLR